ncbi:MAG: hypothetical protein M1288_04185 [Actinobacteria bacterium]|jgi:hypothetical protein|nr:hypothetical protein [Actinomycetota bacterium]
MSPDVDSLKHFLAVPYVAEFEVVEYGSGEWWCQAEYPELSGTEVRAKTVLEAVDLLERIKREVVTAILIDGKLPTKPRPPLRSGVCGLSSDPVT